METQCARPCTTGFQDLDGCLEGLTGVSRKTRRGAKRDPLLKRQVLGAHVSECPGHLLAPGCRVCRLVLLTSEKERGYHQADMAQSWEFLAPKKKITFAIEKLNIINFKIISLLEFCS